VDQAGNKRVVSRGEAERMEAAGEVAAWLSLLNDGTLVAVPVD
jgi:hypothetical protein